MVEIGLGLRLGLVFVLGYYSCINIYIYVEREREREWERERRFTYIKRN